MKSTTAHEDQFAPEPTPAEEEAWRELEARQSTVKASLAPEQPVSGADGLQVDINDVRQYLDSWGCMEHPGVRAVVDAYQPQPSGNAEDTPRLPADDETLYGDSGAYRMKDIRAALAARKAKGGA